MAAQALSCLAALCSSLLTVVVSHPLALPVVAAVAVVFANVARTYQPTAAEAKRLVFVLHGPVVSHLGECCEGGVCARAFRQRARAEAHAVALLEASACAQTFNIALQRWLSLRLELLGASMLLAVGLLTVFSARRGDALGPSGLALTYSLTFTGLAKYFVNYVTRADAQFASVERLQALSELPFEPTLCGDGGEGHGRGDNDGSAAVIPPEWPQRGELVLHAYQPAAYIAAAAPALAPLTMRFSPGLHVALVGRSGSGKSTLLAALLRLLPRAAGTTGTLSLDEFETGDVPLSRWRRAIEAVPQEPLLLAGTIAFNLDPEGTFDHEALWRALRLSGLEHMIADLPDQLNSRVLDRGSSVQLSGGQRQLLALTRLLLRRHAARVVLVDEPAAGVDEPTSARMHLCLNEQFAHATLIAVTHRLLPLLHLFARVAVFENGACVEHGSPADLMYKPGSEIKRLFDAAPLRLQAHMRRMLALQRLRGLAAVRGLWHSAHHIDSTGQSPTNSDKGSGGATTTSKGMAQSTGSLRSYQSHPTARASPPKLQRRGWRKTAHATRSLPWSALSSRAPAADTSPQPAPTTTLRFPAPPLGIAQSSNRAFEAAPPATRSVLGRQRSRASKASSHSSRGAKSFATRELPWTVLSGVKQSEDERADDAASAMTGFLRPSHEF